MNIAITYEVGRRNLKIKEVDLFANVSVIDKVRANKNHFFWKSDGTAHIVGF